MTTLERTSVTVKIVAVDPPFSPGDGVLFGLQSRREVDDPLPASTTTEFETTIDIMRSAESRADTPGAAADFAGEHVHGRRGDRFIYLSWGLADSAEPFVMFARAKIKLAGIPVELLEAAIEDGQVLIVELQATNDKCQPASGTIKPPAITWKVRSRRTP